MSVKFAIRTEGLTETLEMLGRFPERAKDLLSGGLYTVAEEVMTRAKEIVPVDTGNLKSTGHVAPPEIRGNEASVELGFGGTAGKGTEVGYAFYVHEDMTAHHRVGQAKYLEQPLSEAMDKIDDRLAENIEHALR
jgi:hypothetical protein